MTSHCQFYYYKIRRLFYWLSKFFVLIAVDLMSTKHGFMLASVSLIQRAELITSKLVSLLFPKVWRNCVISLQNTIVLKFVWNLPASIGSLYLIFWKKQIFLLFLLIPNIRNYKKETRLTERMRNEFVIYSCVKWLNLPLFHLLKFAIEFQETSRNNRPL